MDPLAELAAKVMQDSHEDTSRLAEIIKDYNPSLRLFYVPKHNRTDPHEESFPFAIVQEQVAGDPVLVMHLTQQEIGNPQGVLARLFNSDNSKHGPGGVLARVETAERAKKIWEAKKHEEEMAERMDFWKSVWLSPKHTFRHNGRKLSI